MSVSIEELRTSFEAAGQGHVLRHWGELDAAQREAFTLELGAMDLELIARLREQLSATERGRAPGHVPGLEPPETFPLERGPDEERRAAEARAHGAELLASGRVGFVLVAGGQGSRLGFDGPKGAYEVGPVTNKSLFEWHAARLLAAGARHGFRPTWYVMTSAANDASTRAFFATHEHFGLPVSDVVFFTQDMLPALDLEGRILLSSPGSLFLAPNGHGGTLAALATSGALADAKRRGIEQLSYFQVDNPLTRPADAVFLGLHDAAGAQMSSKVVAKRDAAEKVGVIGRIDGKLGCIEYSDLSDELREAREASGALLFNAGNIAAHVIRRDFVESLTGGGAFDLPWHIARKEIDTIDAEGRPTRVAGVKFETFVFDALGKAERSVTVEADRAEEFSPVKNAEGSDSPATCRADLSRIGRELSGAAAGSEDEGAVEVDPRVAETADEFAASGASPRHTSGGIVFER